MDEGRAPLSDGDAPKMSFAFRCCRITILLAPSVWCLGWVVPHHWKYEESSHLHYLDTWGIRAAVWGALFVIIAIGLVLYEHSPPFKDHGLKQPNLPSSQGLDPSDFQEVFELTWMNLVKVLVLFGKVALNITFIGYNFYSLPRRDPDEPLNQAKHAVSWVETGMIGFFILALFTNSLPVCRNLSAHVFLVRKDLENLSGFSVLQSISLANPMKVIPDLQRRYRVGGFGGALLSVASMLFFFCSAIASVMVKLAQVDFVTDEVYWDWSWWNFLQLAGFINNLAGLGPNMTDVRLEAVWQFLELDSRGAEPWLRALFSNLVDHYGFSRGMMYALTISDVDVYKLLNMNNRKQGSDTEAYHYQSLEVEGSKSESETESEGCVPDGCCYHDKWPDGCCYHDKWPDIDTAQLLPRAGTRGPPAFSRMRMEEMTLNEELLFLGREQ